MSKSLFQTFTTSAALTRQPNTLSILFVRHWSIESQLYWMLDIVFREDTAKAKKDYAPLNYNVLRKNIRPLLKYVSAYCLMIKAFRNPDLLDSLIAQF